MKRFKVVTLCGSTRFKDDFIEIQKKLTLDGFIVISVGLFGHSGDDEVWDSMDEGKISDTKIMLDEMHKEKIDLADMIYVINPDGYIGSSTWSEICYAYMTNKDILSMTPISPYLIEAKVRQHIMMAERLASKQFDVYSHLASDYPGDSLLQSMVTIKKNGWITVDPWVPEDETVPTISEPYPRHADKESGFDPFKIYGKKDMAKFVESIIMRDKSESEKNGSDKYQELLREVEWYVNAVQDGGVSILPENYPNMTIEEMEDFIGTWSEYNPDPEFD